MKKYYNGKELPGFDTSMPPSVSPRWMVVWDSEGPLSTPVRRIVVGFNGKFVTSDGVEYDQASELPTEYLGRVWKGWRELPDSMTKSIFSKYMDLLGELTAESKEPLFKCESPIPIDIFK